MHTQSVYASRITQNRVSLPPCRAEGGRRLTGLPPHQDTCWGTQDSTAHHLARTRVHGPRQITGAGGTTQPFTVSASASAPGRREHVRTLTPRTPSAMCLPETKEAAPDPAARRVVLRLGGEAASSPPTRPGPSSLPCLQGCQGCRQANKNAHFHLCQANSGAKTNYVLILEATLCSFGDRALGCRGPTAGHTPTEGPGRAQAHRRAWPPPFPGCTVHLRPLHPYQCQQLW